MALRADGTVVAWGTNEVGEVTIPLEATNVVMVAVFPALRKIAPADEEVNVMTRFDVVLTGLPPAS